MNYMSKRAVYAIVFIVILAVLLTRLPKVSPLPATQSDLPQPSPGTPGQVTKTTGCESVNGLPDPACTPGEADPRVTTANLTSTICKSGYTKTVRPVVQVTNKIKQVQMLAYGNADSLSNYELDHLIPLELGGCPDCPANLWPEPYAGSLGAKEKDKVENYLHREVCNGRLALETAQQEIAANWTAVYQRLVSP